MTKKIKPRWLNRSLMSGIDPMLTLVTSQEEYDAVRHSLTGESSPEEWLSSTALGCVTVFESPTGGGLALVVSMRIDPDDLASATRTLVHESVHVAQRIFASIGERKPSKEFQAYLTEGAFTALYEELAKRVRKMGTAESPIEKHLTQQAEAVGGKQRKVVYQGRTGSPDRWLMLPGGRLLIVECKSSVGKPKRHQRREMQELREQGFYVAWINSKENADTIIQQRMADMPIAEFNKLWEL